MQITIFGFIIAAFGLVLLVRGGVMAMLLLMMGCSLLGGSAALVLTAIGGSSVQPVQFALLFAIARIVLPGSRRLVLAGHAIRANMFLGLYALYGVVAATFAPRFFRDAIRVAPMRGTGVSRSIFDTVPLAPSAQNITASVYMVGSFLAGVVAFVAMQERNAAQRFVRMGLIVAWLHIALGVLAAVLKGTPFDLFVDFMRNATYTQHAQSVEGIVRLTGIFPEPSSYAAFAFGWFVFHLECWLRDIMPRRTGATAAVLALVLICSTSSTAYVALAMYGIIFGARVLLFPQHLGTRKGLTIAAIMLLLLIAVSAAGFMFPAFVDSMTTLLLHMTVDKQQSASGLQRAFWAKTGLDAFMVSYGLGIGPGSFRSSSFFTAMVGAVGAIGTALLLGHLFRALKPLRVSTYCGYRDASRWGEDAMVGVAAAWAAIGILLPASIISPTCDVGGDFAIFTAIALALRRPAARAPGEPDDAGEAERSFRLPQQRPSVAMS